MGSPSFRFKQFEIWHDRCAQKVGTDGVLLGAWADLKQSKHILDVGTGSGLIALMAAQRASEAEVVGIEIDPDAARQASENAQRSPFSERITITQSDVRDFHSPLAFDCILSNPPFFTEETCPPVSERAIARNTATLTFVELIAAVGRLLADEGCFHVVLPSSAVPGFVALCLERNLHLERQCLVSTVAGKAPKRSLLTFVSGIPSSPLLVEQLVLQTPDGRRTEAYQRLASSFYL